MKRFVLFPPVFVNETPDLPQSARVVRILEKVDKNQLFLVASTDLDRCQKCKYLPPVDRRPFQIFPKTRRTSGFRFNTYVTINKLTVFASIAGTYIGVWFRSEGDRNGQQC